MSYETLDAIADAYIPLLLLIFLMAASLKLFRGWPMWRPVITHILLLIGLLCIAYGFMLLDNVVGVWPSLELDYSTHTAVALALIFSLCQLMYSKRAWLMSSFVAYLVLMLYQEYHTAADIISTTIVVTACSFVLLKLGAVFRRGIQSNP